MNEAELKTDIPKYGIIGIAGKKNSGKDTVALMIDYILQLNNIEKANYADYIRSIKTIDHSAILHFADRLKQALSIMFNINIEHFNNRLDKDHRWFVYNRHEFITEKEACSHAYRKVENLKEFFDSNLPINIYEQPYRIFKLRSLMQYFGTDIGRRFANDLWIKSCIIDAIDCNNLYGHAIIADVRFENEATAIQQHILYGGLIRIIRDEADISNHYSERLDFKCEYTIKNTGSLILLFENVLDIIKQITNKKKNEVNRTISENSDKQRQ